jgi:hypothetical protein
LAGAYTFKNKQSSSPIADVKPYAAGVSEEAPVCGQNGGSLRASVVVLLSVGARGAANLSLPSGGAAYRILWIMISGWSYKRLLRDDLPFEDIDTGISIITPFVDSIA